MEHSEKLLLRLQSFHASAFFLETPTSAIGLVFFFFCFHARFPPKTLDIGQTFAVTRFPLVKGGRSINDI